MLRIVIAAALVATLYAHSPHRPTDSLVSSLAQWVGPARDELATAALTSETGQALAQGALRRTFDGGPSPRRVSGEHRP